MADAAAGAVAKNLRGHPVRKEVSAHKLPQAKNVSTCVARAETEAESQGANQKSLHLFTNTTTSRGDVSVESVEIEWTAENTKFNARTLSARG